MTDVHVRDAEDKERLISLYGITGELVRRVHEALEEGRSDEVVALLHAADMADQLEQLPGAERDFLVESLGTSLEAKTYTHLDDAVREDIIENIDNAALANVVVELEHDDAVGFIESLEATDQQEVLEAMPAQDRVLLEDSLRFPEESAGRLMRRDAATIPSYWN
ncbi:MAG: magnesium transporter MgtE N-terminal domain-containing protein, partial [Alphaproteobacteria bacterium]